MDNSQANLFILNIDKSATHLTTTFDGGLAMRWRVFGTPNSRPPLVLVHATAPDATFAPSPNKSMSPNLLYVEIFIEILLRFLLTVVM